MSNLWSAVHQSRSKCTPLPGDTLPALFCNAVAVRGDKVFMRQKELGVWRSWTWAQAGDAVRELCMGLVFLGFEPRHTASILANTLVDWVLADMAVLCAGGVSNGIYPTDAPTQVQFLCEDSSTRILFVENEEQLDKALEVRASLPLLQKIIVFDTKGLMQFKDPMVMSLAQLRALGAEHQRREPQLFEARCHACKTDELAILIYTSGTTGRPKGAMHSHQSILYTMKGYEDILGQGEADERMCFLPLCHVAERIGGAYYAMYTGTVLNFVENPHTVPENVREISPTVMVAVPRVWEKFYSAVTIAVSESGAVQKLLYGWAIGVGYAVAQRVLDRQPVSARLKLQFLLARTVALGNVRRLIGIDNARYLATGAAPISPDLVRWYLALGVPMLEVWGQTESCGGTSVMPIDRIKLGSIGLACPFNEVTVDPNNGELLIRGRNVFMGYLNQPEKTAETVDAQGWLHTGDVGQIDAQGYIRITDRLKDIIITAGGKNITPSELENELKFSNYITDAVVIGDKRPYLTVLIMIDQENVEKFAQDQDVPFSNYTSLTRAPQVQALIALELERVNKKFARVEQIKKFRLLENQLSAEDEELTPTMKLKRNLVQRKYADLIESMYVNR